MVCVEELELRRGGGVGSQRGLERRMRSTMYLEKVKMANPSSAELAWLVSYSKGSVSNLVKGKT